ncbi:MAG: hypothetical protein DRH33_07965 [Candidatus Nealsonbacteria bacterium]|nr:MAG: hypothetical protein DRH33_07965 [Candidatus Nealsonbacteria bacterium]
MSQATAGTLDITFKAGADLTNFKYHFVKLDGSGGVVSCGVAKELSIGILQNAPAEGKAARVRLLGTSKLVMGGACSENALLTPDVNGHGVLANTDKDYVGAIALEASGGADEIIEVLITKLHLIVSA